MVDRPSAITVGDMLESYRQRRFVGRASEIELFQAALDSPQPLFSVLHIYGPPGVGKTSLLDVFAGLAARAEAIVVRLDGRELSPSPPAVMEVLRKSLDVPVGEGPVAIPSDTGRMVVLRGCPGSRGT